MSDIPLAQRPLGAGRVSLCDESGRDPALARPSPCTGSLELASRWMESPRPRPHGPGAGAGTHLVFRHAGGALDAGVHGVPLHEQLSQRGVGRDVDVQLRLTVGEAALLPELASLLDVHVHDLHGAGSCGSGAGGGCALRGPTWLLPVPKGLTRATSDSRSGRGKGS